jgi:uncharacterized C2H2 Zn-finger protein
MEENRIPGKDPGQIVNKIHLYKFIRGRKWKENKMENK